MVHAADSYASFNARIIATALGGVGYIEHVLRIDIHAARSAKLEPLIQKIVCLIENLHAIISSVTDQ